MSEATLLLSLHTFMAWTGTTSSFRSSAEDSENISSPIPPSSSSVDDNRKFEVSYVSRAGHVARMGDERRAYRVLVGKPEGKRPLGIPRHRWVDNIRMDLQEV